MVDYNPLIPCLDHGTCDKRNHGFDLQWFMADIAFHSLVHSKCLITILSKSHKWGYLIYGGFLKWGVPLHHPFLDWGFPLQTIHFGDPPFMESPITGYNWVTLW